VDSCLGREAQSDRLDRSIVVASCWLDFVLALHPLGQYGFRELIGLRAEPEAAGFAIVGEAVFEFRSTPDLLKTGQR
jgi:hypothetical protein